jgi:AmiR/NasT family two-component response regulator
MQTRHLIGLAKGVLMPRYDLDADRAFSVLRRQSQQSNVKLRDVAARIVTERRSL